MAMRGLDLGSRGERRESQHCVVPVDGCNDARTRDLQVCWAGGEKQGGEEPISIRVGWSERRCDAVLFIAGSHERKAAANILGLLAS